MEHILLVEDNQNNADLIIRLLTTAGYTVKHFARGLDGAKAARQQRPALILMDFNLPDIDGRTLVLTLRRQLGDHQAPPIVAVTARTGLYEEKIAMQFGCAAFVNKPFNPEKFVALIESLVGKGPSAPSADVAGDVSAPTPKAHDGLA